MKRRKRHSPQGIHSWVHRIGAFRFGGFGDILDVQVGSTRSKRRIMKVSKLLVEDEEAVDAGQDLVGLE